MSGHFKIHIPTQDEVAGFLTKSANQIADETKSRLTDIQNAVGDYWDDVAAEGSAETFGLVAKQSGYHGDAINSECGAHREVGRIGAETLDRACARVRSI